MTTQHTRAAEAHTARIYRSPLWVAWLAGSLLGLSACGGGGDAGSDGTEASQAQATSASAATLPSDAGTTADLALDAALAVDPNQLSTQALSTRTAQAAEPQVSGSAACAGGGSVTLTLTGPSLPAVLNGVPDAGERYALSFSACQSAEGGAALTGDAVLSITAATQTSVALTLATGASGLQATLPAGAATLVGSMSLQRSQSGDPAASSSTTTQWSATSIQLDTERNGRTARFTLSDAACQRHVQWQAGLLQSSQFQGSLTLAASGATRAYSVQLSSSGGMIYDAEGQPTSGSMSLALPDRAMDLSLAQGAVTLTVDVGADGTVDHQYQWSRADWLALAGQ